ncbi:MAG: sialate O-acetylesterase [Bacteroidia bacterium]
MKNKLTGIIFLTISLFLTVTLQANIQLPALVGDNMVLQQNEKINLWGWADVNEKVSVEFPGQEWSTQTGKDGKWEIVLNPMKAGGPYEMTIKGKNVIVLKNILIGEVWLASGQSNMEWPLYNINDAKEEIESANFPQIRLFTVEKKYAFQPQKDIISKGWQVCSPATVDSFSAVAYLFGRELHQRYKVPIGLIHSSWGGTPAQTWTSQEGLKPFPELAEKAQFVANISDSEFETYQKSKANWIENSGTIDRGRTRGASSWADKEMSTSGWAKMTQPSLWYDHLDLKRFGGTIWFRKEVHIPPKSAGKAIEVSLGNILLQDSAFFNGYFIGTNTGYDPKRNYPVPGHLVKSGSNMIALRITGVSEFGGIIGDPRDMYITVGDQKISLEGEWLYKTGPDLSTMPQLKGVSDFSETMPQSPTLLFNGMLAPLIPYTIKGVIWYQGESNADNMEEADQYYTLFPAMIKDWRKQWSYDFPFLFVQLAGYKPDHPEPADYPWADLREAQAQTLALPHTGMATTIDIGEVDDIHPRNKQDVAHRLALAARKIAYGEDIIASGPTFSSMKIEGDKIRLKLDNIGSGLWVKGSKYGYVKGFAIAGKNKKFVWAQAWLEGDEIIINAKKIKAPVAVRYNWGNSPDGNLYNREELPAVPFRTDDW